MLWHLIDLRVLKQYYLEAHDLNRVLRIFPPPRTHRDARSVIMPTIAIFSTASIRNRAAHQARRLADGLIRWRSDPIAHRFFERIDFLLSQVSRPSPDQCHDLGGVGPPSSVLISAVSRLSYSPAFGCCRIFREPFDVLRITRIELYSSTEAWH